MREIVSGIGLMIVGLAFAVAAYANLPLGTLRSMGPGMFPMGLGGLLAIIGAGITAIGFFQRHDAPHWNFRTTAAVLGAVGAFALLIDHVGLFAAILASTVISSLAAPGSRFRATLYLCLGLMLVAWVLFILILDIQFDVFSWRW